MKETDAYYTPSSVATQLLSAVKGLPRRRLVVADFSAGEGELLAVAAARWSTATLVANDVAERPLRKLRSRLSRVRTAQCDFYLDAPCERSKVLRQVKERCDLVLANPPFSARGSRRMRVSTARAGVVSGSPAGVYLVRCFAYLRPGGQAIAIMPASFVHSEKDESVRLYLRTFGELSVGAQLPISTFDGCSPRTVIVRVRKPRTERSALPRLVSNVGPERESAMRHECQSLVRGVIPNGVRFPSLSMSARYAHTTHLATDGVEHSIARVPVAARSVRGPCILLPRVGFPLKRKIVAYRSGKPLYLSDCLIALTVGAHDELQPLREHLKQNFGTLRAAYGGTGAPYITVARLLTVLREIGVVVKRVDNARRSARSRVVERRRA